MDPLPYMEAKDCSCSSLESAASNQSEGSVFTSSPVGSPACPRRANASTPAAAKAQQDITPPISDEKRRSQSMRATSRVLMRTRSLGAFSRSLKKDTQKENAFPCGTLPEDSQSEADPPAEPLLKPRPLSYIEMFKVADSKMPCRPPSYEHAMHSAPLPPHYGTMTVRDAERRSRPNSVNYDFPPASAMGQYVDCFNQAGQDVPFRQRAMSESVSASRHEVVSRRCSQPVFEELSRAKESYV